MFLRVVVVLALVAATQGSTPARPQLRKAEQGSKLAAEKAPHGWLLAAKPDKPLLLGEGQPMLMYAMYLGSILPLVYAACTMDLSPYVGLFSKITLSAFAGTGFLFAAFGYFLNPNLLCNAANMFTFFESKLLGRPFKFFELTDSYNMFQAAIDSVKDPAKSPTAENFMFAITIKLRIECFFWLVSALVCSYCLTLPLAERKILHLFVAMMGTGAMVTDFNHVSYIPFNILGYNHFVNNIGRFIGYAFGFTFVFVNFMSYVVVHDLMLK
jgi:hypothetical protein